VAGDRRSTSLRDGFEYRQGMNFSGAACVMYMGQTQTSLLAPWGWGEYGGVECDLRPCLLPSLKLEASEEE